MQHCMQNALHSAEGEALHTPGIVSMMPRRLLCGEIVVNVSQDAHSVGSAGRSVCFEHCTALSPWCWKTPVNTCPTSSSSGTDHGSQDVTGTELGYQVQGSEDYSEPREE